MEFQAGGPGGGGSQGVKTRTPQMHVNFPAQQRSYICNAFLSCKESGIQVF